MTTEFGYTPVKLSEISQGLARLFGSEGDVNMARSAVYNAIIPVSSESSKANAESYVHALSVLRPSRFFIIVPAGDPDALGAEVAARCHGVPNAEPICCEVVRVVCGRNRFAALGELLRANFLSGARIEIFLFESGCDQQMLALLAGMSDQMFFDSSRLDKELENVGSLRALCPCTADMRWIALADWRELIRSGFSRREAAQLLPSMRRTTIRFGGGASAVPVDSLLLAGWIVDRLGLSPRAVQPSGGALHLESRGRKGPVSHIELIFELEPGGFSAIDSVLFDCDGTVAGRTTRIEVSRIEDRLVFVGDTTPPVRIARQIEDESRWGLIRRYFELGEPFGEYSGAFESAIKLRSALRGASSLS